MGIRIPFGMVLAIDPGGDTGVAMCERRSGIWRACEIQGKGAYLKGEGRSLDGVESDGAVMYLDEMAMAQEVCVWAATAVDEIWTQLKVAGESGEVPYVDEVRDDQRLAWEAGDLCRGDLIVIEDFLLRPPRKGQKGANVGSLKRSGLSPARISLSLVTWFEVLDWTGAYGVGLKLQSAANAKHVVNDQRLKNAGLWVTGSDHARDALRHMVLACK